MTLTHENANVSDASIIAAIESYAIAYKRMEDVQLKSTDPACLIPKGDQKTGCIGEYWAMRYAKKRWGNSRCIFGGHSQHGWDIHVKGTDIRVQVKTVSEWSEKKHIGPIDPRHQRHATDPPDWAPWTLLWLIYVGKDFRPIAFWQIERRAVSFRGDGKLRNQRIRVPGEFNSGSARIKWPENTIGDLLSTASVESRSIETH